MEEPITVSIFCLAYNHEKTIAQAIESFLMQKTSFAYEVVIHDDCSTDGTAEIIRTYEKRYPDIIKPIYQTTNQYSQGIDIFHGICIPVMRGTYVAVCEGDDYWIDDQKLQIQYEAMKQHPEVDMCACGALEMMGEQVNREVRPKKQDAVLSVEEVIVGGGSYIATASLFYKKALFESSMAFEKVIDYDYSNQIKGSLRGGIYYIDRNMAAYRKNAEGSWTERMKQNPEAHAQWFQKEFAMLRQLDIDTDGKYHESIEQRIANYIPFIMQLHQVRDEVVRDLATYREPMYLWGLGVRGDAVQNFCQEENIEIAGVCDQKNRNIGERNSYGNLICETGWVLANAKVILASNDAIADALRKEGYQGTIVPMQKYMMLG